MSAKVASLLSAAKPGGRPEVHARSEVVKAVSLRGAHGLLVASAAGGLSALRARTAGQGRGHGSRATLDKPCLTPSSQACRVASACWAYWAYRKLGSLHTGGDFPKRAPCRACAGESRRHT